jgi:glycosyltransferase involved in cell wall biosynthesis
MQELLPKISIVTPSYNQGEYIEQTILSVIYQGYDNLEYFVLDGGSTDNTVEVIKKYEDKINYWHSKKDNGQSAAINEGFAMSTGDILYWLNSDDVLLPGTLLKIGRLFKSVTEPTLIFGNCLHYHQVNLKVRGSNVVKAQQFYKLSLYDYLIQPSTFWNRAAWEITGKINDDIYYVMDWEWFVRAEKAGVKFVGINDYISIFRLHDVHKTSTKGIGNKRDIEMAEIYGRFNSENIKNAFIKLKMIKNKSQFMHNVIYAAEHYNLTFISHLLHLLLFPKISYYEYKNISGM